MSSSEEVKNKDDKDLEEIDEIKPTPRPKKKMNLSQEERDKRADRMRKLRAKLDNLGSVKTKVVEKENKKIPVKKIPTKPKEIKKEVVEEKNEESTDIESEWSVESEEEEQKPILKKLKSKKPVIKNNRKIKPTPRKVLKIKYYSEPSQAEMLQDRIFLENQHKADNENQYLKKKNQTKEKDIDDLTTKLFNY